MTVNLLHKIVSFAIFAMLSSGFWVLSTHTSPAEAMDLQARDGVIYLSGEIKPGSSIAFEKFIHDAPKGTFRYVFLSSGGGFVSEAVDIGRAIRKEGLSTIVDASKSLCASACTAIFASGVQRHYLNASSITDGSPKKICAGLGFHDGSSSRSLDANHYSGIGAAVMTSAYHEFGVPNAAQLLNKASPNDIFLLSGKTALALGIATSLGKL